ncbi:MAG: hypothetical protein GTO02_08335 [Candidatus Dadabacteria bacterium]|nr:hypothetical protein [Candidatus Dadabacteria bacterium]NIQ14395.1 hypothetical protein [Candidatus Dadabacteria bacterium]
MAGASDREDDFQDSPYTARFNTVNGANYADVIGYGFQGEEFGVNLSTVTNLDLGFSFDVFVFDMDEEPLSCDRRNFACGNVMNYGINEDYPNSRGGPLLCPGGGLANSQGGFINFVNGTNDGLPPASDADSDAVFVHFIGINNNDGTGSMDNWTWFNED